MGMTQTNSWIFTYFTCLGDIKSSRAKAYSRRWLPLVTCVRVPSNR